MFRENLLLIILSACVVITAFVFKINTRYNVGIDGIQYIAYTKNFIDGNGIAFSNTLLADLAKTIFVSMQGYPPGYCLLLGTAGIMGVDLLLANALLDALAIIIFYFTSVFVLILLGFAKRLLIIFALLSIFFLPPFFYGNSSDLWSAVFFQGGVAMALYMVRYQKLNLRYFLFLGIILFGAALVRYAYYPLVFVVPCVLGWLAYHQNNQKLWKGVGLSTFVLAACILALSAYQKMNTGTMVYLNQGFAIPDERLLYPENLEKFDPFVLNSFFDLDLLMSEVEQAWVVKSVHGFSLLVSIIILVFIVRQIFFVNKSHRSITHPVWQTYLMLGILSTMVIIGLLAALSLKDPRQIWGEWTYVEETRYYMPAMVFILIYALSLLENKSVHRNIRVFTIILLFMSFAFTTGLWFSHHYKGLKRKNEKIAIYHKTKELVKKSSKKVVYAEAGISNMYFVSIAGATPLMKLVDTEKLLMENQYEQLLQKKKLTASEPVLLLVRTYASEPASLDFVKKFNGEKVLSFSESDVYVIEINASIN